MGGKNKGGGGKSGGKKGSKKKAVDPFTRKDWYNILTPNFFKVRVIGKTFVNRTQGTKIASDSLKKRIYEASLADLQDDEIAFRKFKLICEDVQGTNVLTHFHGMRITTDKHRSMVKKWQNLVEAHCDVKTTDGYTLRIICIGFTKKAVNQVKKTTYAYKWQIQALRKRMIERISREISKTDIRGVVEKLIPDSIAKDIEKSSPNIYPLYDVVIRQVKIVKKPKFDNARFMSFYTDRETKKTKKGKKTVVKVSKKEEPMKVDRPDRYEPPIQQSV